MPWQFTKILWLLTLCGTADLSTPSRHTWWNNWPPKWCRSSSYTSSHQHTPIKPSSQTAFLRLQKSNLHSPRRTRPPLWPTSFLTVNTISLSHNCLACYLSSRPISLVNSSSMNDRINISKAPFSTISSAALSPANPIHLFRLLSYSTKGFHTSRGSITCTYKFAYKLSMRLLEIKKFKVLFHTARNRRSLTRTGAHIGPGKWGVRVSPLWDS